MKTIRQLASLHGLSRSTLLYYDEIGLLHPTTRTAAGYRLYNEDCEQRLSSICQYRSAGLPLDEIKRILEAGKSQVTQALQNRLSQINDEIHELRSQQQSIVNILRHTPSIKKTRFMDKARWVELLRASGFSDDDMRRWHHTFELHSPEAHQDFLESLGIDPEEIRSIRQHSQQQG